MSKYHEEYSLRHKVEFRPDEFADDPRTFAHPAIRIICAPNRYGIGDEQTWHRSQTPMPNHAHLPLYVIDHSAVHISLTPFAGAGPGRTLGSSASWTSTSSPSPVRRRPCSRP